MFKWRQRWKKNTGIIFTPTMHNKFILSSVFCIMETVIKYFVQGCVFRANTAISIMTKSKNSWQNKNQSCGEGGL